MSHPHHPSFEPSCGVCQSLSGPDAHPPIYEDELWVVRHIDPPHGVAGWMMLLTKRHVGGPAHFDAREAASFGLVLRHFERTLEDITGALRIYTAAMGESHPHFHCHMVPRYKLMHDDAKAWGVFDLQRRAAAGELTVDPSIVSDIVERYHKALKEHPAPHG